MLVGGLEHEFYFSPIVGMMIQSDELIFFRGVETTNQDVMMILWYFMVIYWDLMVIYPKMCTCLHGTPMVSLGKSSSKTWSSGADAPRLVAAGRRCPRQLGDCVV